MSPSLTVVVAAVPALVHALRATGQFAQVLGVDSTSGLRDLLGSGTLSNAPNDKVFIFADSTPVDTEQSLPLLVTKLGSLGAPVVIVATSPAARDLMKSCPSAGLLESHGPLRLNQVLGALSGKQGLPVLQPVPTEQNLEIALPGMAPAFTPAPSGTATPFGAHDTSVHNSRPAAPQSAGGFAAQPAVPLTMSGITPGATPAMAPFAQAAPAPAATPTFGSSGPAFGAHDTPSPFGNSDTQSAASGASASPFGNTPTAPASPFGSATPSPFGDTPPPSASPFSTDSTAPPAGSSSPFESGPASPFGTPPTPAPPSSPFGSATPSPFGGAPAGGSSPFGAGTYIAPSNPGFGGAPVARAGAAPLERPTRKGHVVTIAAPKGGTGKSTIALNLAAYLGLRLRGTGRNVCLIDANVQQADSGKYLNVWTPNIEGLLKDPNAIHPDRIGEHLVEMPQLNMSVLLGPATPEVANPLYYSGKRYSAILDALKPNFDYILIDTPVAEVYHDMFVDFALPRADFVAVIGTPNITTLMNVDAWLQVVTAPVHASGMGVDPQKIGIVLNRAENDIGIDEDAARRELGEWRFLAGVPETKEWKRCNNEGTLVATKNYHELNEAFSIILQAATGEELVTAGSGLPAAKPSRGLMNWLRRGKS